MRSETDDMRARGFSLIEMMVVIAVLAILVGVSIPSFSFFINRTSALTAEADFVSALSYARSESMKRGVSVYVTAAGPATGTSFGGGWSVWVDQNGNGTQDATEPTIRSHAAFPAGTSIADGSTTQVAFAATGFQLAALTRTLKVCNTGAPGTAGYSVQVLPNGLTDVTNNVTCP